MNYWLKSLVLGVTNALGALLLVGRFALVYWVLHDLWGVGEQWALAVAVVWALAPDIVSREDLE